MMEQAAMRPGNAATESTSGVTVEHGLFGVVAAIAIGMRFVGLADAPLAPVEAGHAWAAWQAAAAMPVAGAPAPTSALLYGLDALLFFLFGGSDLLARLVPALAGVATVLLPWFWRATLGRTAALAVALLFAVDPWLTALSRYADGAALAIFLALLALSAIWQWQENGRRRWERTLAVSLGLLLTAGALAWSFVPVLALAAWLAWRSRPQQVTLRRATILWFLGALLVGATGLLTRPEAVAALGASLTAWICGVTGCSAASQPWWWAIARLWIDQPFVAVFGALGLVTLWVPVRLSRRPLALLLTLWAVWGFVLCLLPGRSPLALVVFGLPLVLAAGVLVERLLRIDLGDVSGLEIAVLLTVEAVLLISGVIWLTSLVDSGAYSQQLLLTGAILLGLALLVWVVFGFWGGWRAAAKLAGIFFGVLLLLTTVRSSWLLNHLGGPMQPQGFWPVATEPGVRMLAEDVQRLSSMRRGDPYETMVQVVTPMTPDPVLGWYLRDMRDVRWVLAPQPDAAALTPAPPGAQPAASAPLIITPSDAGWADNPALTGYLGSSYGLRWRWDMTQLPALPPVDETQPGLDAQQLAELRGQQAWPQETRPRLEWLFYRKVSALPAIESVDLWARAID
jgi:hypothetical protein